MSWAPVGHSPTGSLRGGRWRGDLSPCQLAAQRPASGRQVHAAVFLDRASCALRGGSPWHATLLAAASLGHLCCSSTPLSEITDHDRHSWLGWEGEAHGGSLLSLLGTSWRWPAHSAMCVPGRFSLLLRRRSTESSLHWRVKDLSQEDFLKTLLLGKAQHCFLPHLKRHSEIVLEAISPPIFPVFWENKPTLKARWWKVSFNIPCNRGWRVRCSELKKWFRAVYHLAKFVLLYRWRGINPKYLLAAAEMRYDGKEKVNRICALKLNLISPVFWQY